MPALPFQIKICGVTTPEDARLAAGAGADAIGLNFYRTSKRYVALDRAAEVAAALPSGVARVGVFVNPAYEEVIEAAERVPLDVLQFHGNEAAEFLAQFRDQVIVRAWRFGIAEASLLDEYLSCCAALKSVPRAVLFDSGSDRNYGGTGTVADWQAIAAWRQKQQAQTSVVLAGGLTPQNVAAAIAAVRPDAVDTASGVESAPGQKDPQLVEAFVRAARQALTASR